MWATAVGNPCCCRLFLRSFVVPSCRTEHAGAWLRGPPISPFDLPEARQGCRIDRGLASHRPTRVRGQREPWEEKFLRRDAS